MYEDTDWWSFCMTWDNLDLVRNVSKKTKHKILYVNPSPETGSLSKYRADERCSILGRTSFHCCLQTGFGEHPAFQAKVTRSEAAGERN
jgi:hypothetical protein